MGTATKRSLQLLRAQYPFLKAPIIVSAPMRVFAGPALATATSRAGGLGFIGPGPRPTDLEPKLEKARTLLLQDPIPAGSEDAHASESLPIGVGFQLFDGDLEVAAAAVQKYKPIAAWLFVSASGQSDIDRWTSRLRKESNNTKIWLQVGSVAEAIEASTSRHAPDVLVLQGTDAGGHGLRKGAGILSLLPEVSDSLFKLGVDIPLFAAGGIVDGRGVAAVMATGVAAGAVMGTRFLASKEAEISKGYQDDILRVIDGGQTTVRTTLFDRLQGRDDWPSQYDGRAIVNASVRDDEAGMDQAANKEKFQEVQQTGLNGWGSDGRLTSYVGSAVGLVKSVDSAKDIVEHTRKQARMALQEVANSLID
jgi:nitronate monooxygenase